MSIVVLDYDRGNLRSVAKALEHCGAQVRVTQDPREVERAEKLVVPGVGAFGDCVKSLERLQMGDAIRAHIVQKKPFLGICLGLQILFEESEETPGVQGLGVLPGRVVKFVPQSHEQKVPHMGWNTLHLLQADHPMWKNIPEESAVYFVHSYYVVPKESGLVAATSEYGTPFCAAVATESLFACQFHPEKSQELGLQVLKNFVSF